jgi:2-hydroxy-3-keto-5-methylthiopentenyl-1-phosphate phosphatase
MEVCELHGVIDKKLDRMLELQLEQVEKITRLEDAIHNGLKSAVFETNETVKEMSKRVDVLEGFTWFSEWVTKARNNVFFSIIKIGCAFIILMLVWHFGNEALIKLLRL